MRIIKPSFEIWDQEEGLEGVYRQIERAGRVCYKSEDKITETSAKEFVDKMIKSGHGAMLEHGTIYLKRDSTKEDNLEWARRYLFSPYSRISCGEGSHRVDGILYNTVYITTNFRVLVEQNWLDDLKYICEPTEYHEKRVTVKFICDRGVSHEFVRHRVFSFAQESTRYCNYSRSKFGNELTIILPEWWEDGTNIKKELYKEAWQCSEDTYRTLMASKVTPQEARAVLPNSLKTELVMTSFINDWEHFFKLRDAGSAHPQARELAHPLHIEFIKRGYLVNLYDEANPN